MRPFGARPRRRWSGFAGERGMALLVTLTVITAVVTAGLELNRRMRATVTAAAAGRDRFAAEQTAVAGVHAAMALLIKDKLETRADSIQEDWASPEKLAEVLQEIPFDEGRVALEISDERARIQVNALVVQPAGRDFNPEQEMLLDRFLRPIIAEYAALEVKDPVFEELNLTTTIISALKDWIDAGDEDATTGLSGAESDYYESLDPPYRARNAPLAGLEELLRVKGVSPDLYYGLGDLPGIAEYLTVHGGPATAQSPGGFDGKVNINTAALPVLRALLPADTRFRLLLSGGGARNRFIADGLRYAFPEAVVENTAALGVNPDAKEAIAFAVLANEWLMGNTASLPGTTGARRAALLGSLSLPA